MYFNPNISRATRQYFDHPPQQHGEALPYRFAAPSHGNVHHGSRHIGEGAMQFVPVFQHTPAGFQFIPLSPEGINYVPKVIPRKRSMETMACSNAIPLLPDCGPQVHMKQFPTSWDCPTENNLKQRVKKISLVGEYESGERFNIPLQRKNPASIWNSCVSFVEAIVTQNACYTVTPSRPRKDPLLPVSASGTISTKQKSPVISTSSWARADDVEIVYQSPFAQETALVEPRTTSVIVSPKRLMPPKLTPCTEMLRKSSKHEFTYSYHTFTEEDEPAPIPVGEPIIMESKNAPGSILHRILKGKRPHVIPGRMTTHELLKWARLKAVGPPRHLSNNNKAISARRRRKVFKVQIATEQDDLKTLQLCAIKLQGAVPPSTVKERLKQWLRGENVNTAYLDGFSTKRLDRELFERERKQELEVDKPMDRSTQPRRELEAINASLNRLRHQKEEFIRKNIMLDLLSFFDSFKPESLSADVKKIVSKYSAKLFTKS